MIIILDLKYYNILTRTLLQKLLQKKKLFIFVFVFVLFCILLKKLKLLSGLTKLCNFVNKDYYYIIIKIIYLYV